MKSVRYTIKTALCSQAIAKCLIPRNGFSSPSFINNNLIECTAQAQHKRIHHIRLKLHAAKQQAELVLTYKNIKPNYLKILFAFVGFIFLLGFSTQMIFDAPQIFAQVLTFLSIPVVLIYFLGFRKVNTVTESVLNRELAYWLAVLEGDLIEQQPIIVDIQQVQQIAISAIEKQVA